MSDVAEDLVTSGPDGTDPQARIAALTERLLVNPDKIGLRLRLAHVLEGAGRDAEALRLLTDTIARFPRNTMARARLDALRARTVAVLASQEREPPAKLPAPDADASIPIATASLPDPTPPTTAPERRFVAQDELSNLAREARGMPASPPMVPGHQPAQRQAAPMPSTSMLAGMPQLASTYSGDLQAEPSLRLRFNPLRSRHRAEIYFASAVIAVVAVSGLVVWRSPHSGLLVDRDAPTPVVLAPHLAKPELVPPSVMLPPVTLPRAAPRTEPDTLTSNPLAVMVEPSPPQAPAQATQAGASFSAPLPEQTALPTVELDYQAGDAQAAQAVADLMAKLRGAGIAVVPVARTVARQAQGIDFFFAEDAALARTVASLAGGEFGPLQQARPSLGAAMLPGAIRITLAASPQPHRRH